MRQGPIRITLAAALTLVSLSGCAWLTRSSRPLPGRTGVSTLTVPSISASGRFTLFGGWPTDYVEPPTTASRQAMVRDNRGKRIEVVSLGTDGSVADAEATPVDISATGRYVLFSSAASNLVPGDTDGLVDAFVRDRTNGKTMLVSVNDDESQITDLTTAGIALSGDGSTVVFSAASSGLPPTVNELEVRDLTTGTTRVLPHLHGAPYVGPAHLSDDGSLVAYGDGVLNGPASLMWLGIARTDTGAPVLDLGSVPMQFSDAGAANVALSGDGTTYAVASGVNKYDAATSGTVTVGRVDGSTAPVTHHYRWVRNAYLSRDGSVLAVWILLPSAQQVLAIDRGTDPPLVVSADTTGQHAVPVDSYADLSADGKWVTFVTNQNGTMGGDAGDTGWAVYTRSVAQVPDPPS